MRKAILGTLIILLVSVLLVNLKFKTKAEWLFIYYMPYDNNLSVWGNEIVSMLAKGTSKDVSVVIQADFEDTNGLVRYTIIDGKIDSTILSTEETNKKVYEEYLEWVSSNFLSKKYAIVFLNHGGKLSEIGLDEYPTEVYFDCKELADVIKNFNKKEKNKAELLFLQQCSRGNIETVYEFKDCANFCLSSQKALGVPNYYYENTLKAIHANPEITTKALVDSLVKNEPSPMYDSYTLVDNNKVDRFVKSFRSMLLSFDTLRLEKKGVIRYNYLDEQYWDITSFLKSIKTVDPKKTKLINDNISQLKKFLKHYKNPSRSFIKNFNGLSIYSPFNKNITMHKHMAIFKMVDYDKLKHAIVLE